MPQLQPTTEQMEALGALRAGVEGYPQGGQIERHVHDMDQLALISQSTAIIETDEAYVVHPLLKAVWLPAGTYHSVYSSRPFYLHSLYFTAGTVRSATGTEVLGLDPLSRELVLFLCKAPRPSQRGVRHAHALALLMATLADARVESFSLPRPRSERARKLADYLAACPDDTRSLEQIAAGIGGASLRTFERLFVDETGLSLAVWRRQSRLLTSLTLLAQGKSVSTVARAVGYDSTASFSAAFKQCFGTAPTAYVVTESPKQTPGR
jgi:AraC-like DNA-binding protein